MFLNFPLQSGKYSASLYRGINVLHQKLCSLEKSQTGMLILFIK